MSQTPGESGRGKRQRVRYEPPRTSTATRSAGYDQVEVNERGDTAKVATNHQEAPRESAGRGRSPARPAPKIPPRRQWFVVAGASLTVAVAVAVAYMVIFSGEGTQQGQPGAPAGQQAASAQQPPLTDSGLTFSALSEDDGKVTLKTNTGLSWAGKVESGAAGEVLTLTGPTAAQIERGFVMGDSSIESGVFAVVLEDGTVVHATLQAFEGGDKATWQGSYYYAKDGGELAGRGHFTDEAGGSGEEMVRTYYPAEGQPYRVAYKAPAGVPPLLMVGWKADGQAPERAKGNG